MRFLLLTFLLCLLAGCGDSKPMAKVKGRVVKNGQPIEVPPGSLAAVTFTPVVDGKTDDNKSMSAVMKSDGEFELLESGGAIPVGKFHVSILVTGKGGELYKDFAVPATTPLRAELKAGPNDIVLDIAKPNG